MSSLESELRDELNLVIMQLESAADEVTKLRRLSRGLAQAIGMIQSGLDPQDLLIAVRVNNYHRYLDRHDLDD